MLRELDKNGVSIAILHKLSYRSSLGKSLTNSLRRFDKNELFNEIVEIIRFHEESEELDTVDLDCRIKSSDSCLRKYEKFYPEMRAEKVFNDILRFRMLVDNYSMILNGEIPPGIRIIDMSMGKANNDGYRGVHIYYQPDHLHYTIEIQANTYYDRQLNNWLHKYLYKKRYPDFVGEKMRQEYECGKY